jgi:hypothetical protein
MSTGREDELAPGARHLVQEPNREKLAEVSGVGPTKLERYRDEVPATLGEPPSRAAPIP